MRPRLLVLAAACLSLTPYALAQDLPDNASELPISHLLTLASTALSSGKSSSALNIYEHILERDPTDFATLYKRATVRLATGQLAKAKEGFQEVLRVREFDQAYYELARLNAKLGEFEEARRNVETFLKRTKGKESKEITDAQALSKQLYQAEKDLIKARKALAASDLPSCLTSSSSILTLAPNSEETRLLRAECYLLSSEYDSTVGDLSRAAALSPNLPPHLLLRLSLISGLFLDQGTAIPVESLASIKRCLSADPESKTCKKAFKALKAAEKDLAKLRNWVDGGRWAEASLVLAGSSTSEGVIKTIKALIESYQVPLPATPDAPAPLPSNVRLEYESPLLTHLYSTLCRAYVTLGSRKAARACEDVLARNPQDSWGLVGRGEKLMVEENWEEAVRVLSDAFEQTGKSDRNILEKLQKAQRLLKQSKQKDYYKVLGVSRDADAKTIKRAYRKATLKAHPDKEGGSEEKMAALNEAYEVLNNPELRARFDNGEDPNDPSQGQQGNPFGGHPFGGGFQHGGQFFQGGFPGGGFPGGQFKFNFGH